jgi:flagellar hook-associated protein 1 FlgK
MYSSFFGIEIAKKALFAQQRAQETVSHNVANANTPGYSRQRAVLESTYMSPLSSLPGMGQVGTGVRVSDINRIRDSFADRQFRDENSSFGEWDVQQGTLAQVEAVFNEPSDIGIYSVFSQFWQSLEELTKDPASIEVRETVKERAVTLANTINHTAGQLSEIIDDINFRISVKVNEVNNIARQIAELNGQIQKMEITGNTASDLRDKRDVLLDELSKLIDFDYYEDEDGRFGINVGGAILVKANDYDTFTFDKESIPPQVKWAKYGTPVNLRKGELKGLIDLRDNKVQRYLKDLKTFTDTFVEKFNGVHQSGYGLRGETGIKFFVDPADLQGGDLIAVNSEILNDTLKIAAAGNKNGLPGDNTNALALSAIKDTYYDELSGTLNDFYRSLVSSIGIDSQEAARMAESQEYMVSQIDERRKEVSGVSIDEEMAKMIMFQHAYTAAARVITTIDEMLDTIVSRMGITGR